MLTITQEQARNYLIQHTGLNSNRDTLQIIDDLSCLQVDPINVVARSHELLIFNRNKDFVKADLYKALYEDHKLFDGWLQLYSIIPVAAYPYIQAIRETHSSWQVEYRKQHAKELAAVIDFITEHGPTSGKDLAHLPKGSSVQSWKGQSSHTALLEYLFSVGEIQVCNRTSLSKSYDLTERIIPKEYLHTKVSETEAYDFVIDSFFKYLGLTRPIHLFRTGREKAKGLRERFKAQLESGDIEEVRIKNSEGQLSKTKYYIQTAKVEELLSAPAGAHQSLNILSPLDPLIHDRQLTVDAFDFFYRWEAYTPAAKRKYGFYNMPILYHGRIVGQIDMAKSEGKLKTKGLFLTEKSNVVKENLKLAIEGLEKFSLS